MQFKHVINLKRLLVLYNKNNVIDYAKFNHVNMFQDGCWALAIDFGEVPQAVLMFPILNYCCQFHLHAFFGAGLGRVVLYVQ